MADELQRILKEQLWFIPSIIPKICEQSRKTSIRIPDVPAQNRTDNHSEALPLDYTTCMDSDYVRHLLNHWTTFVQQPLNPVA
jgi:hypothetical protein